MFRGGNRGRDFREYGLLNKTVSRARKSVVLGHRLTAAATLLLMTLHALGQRLTPAATLLLIMLHALGHRLAAAATPWHKPPVSTR